MHPTTSILRASRPLFRYTTASGARQPVFRTTSTGFRFSAGGKRFFSDAAPATEQQVQQSWFKKMWDSPIGVKTVHFWAPVMKWALVIAGISDLARPAEKLSLTQNIALTATGIIWTRWCLIIKPKNYLLATVNFFLGCVGVVQVGRIAMHKSSQKEDAVTASEAVLEKAVEKVKSA